MLTRLHETADYPRQRYDFIRQEEGYVPNAYVDTRGIPTIGVGYNLRTWLGRVLETFGFDTNGTVLDGAAALAEEDYIGQIGGAVRHAYAPNASAALTRALNPIMQRRANDARYPAGFASVLSQK